MKMNKKIIVPTLAMLMGAGLVGSISGTVAWYQYSTRAQIGMFGMSMGLDRNLEAYVTAADVTEAPAKNDTKWTTNVTDAKLQEFLGATETFKFNPITTDAAYVKDGSFGTIGFRRNPIQYKKNPTQWELATDDDYLEFKVWIRSAVRDGSDEKKNNPDYAAKELGLYHAKIQESENATKKDISGAVRIQITAGTNYAVMAKDSSFTDLSGYLDLDGDTYDDTEFGYSDVSTNLDKLTYGLDGEKGQTYNLASENGHNGLSDGLYCDDPVLTSGANEGKIAIKGGFNLGATTESAPASFTVKIWLEGWAKIGAPGSESAMWATKDYVQSKFFVGLTVASGDVREA